jgi:hypothetical protein
MEKEKLSFCDLEALEKVSGRSSLSASTYK